MTVEKLVQNKILDISNELFFCEDLLIILLEDDTSARNIFSKWILNNNIKVQSFSSLKELQKCIFAENYNIPKKCFAIVDLVLPDGDGVEIITLWKKKYSLHPIIAITAHATIEIAVECMKAGAFDFLRKPIQKEDFCLAIKKAYDYLLVLNENEQLSNNLRVMGIAQTLAQINERVSLLRILARLLHRELSSDETYLFYHDVNKTQGECLLEIRNPGLARHPPENIYSEIFKYGAIKNTNVEANEPDYYEYENKKIVIYELVSFAGNKATLILFHRQDNKIFFYDKHLELKPILQQALRSFLEADVTAKLSFIDDLTGLYNFRFLEVVIKNEMSRASRYGFSLSLLFIDLDKFKQINDTHGHLAGSQVLREASKVFQMNVRESDYLLRYGGDEFLIVLPNTNHNGAIVLAERIRQSFENYYFDVRDITGINTAYNLNVTTSIGVATYPFDADNVKSLIKKADDAMYVSKKNGKNKVTSAQI